MQPVVQALATVALGALAFGALFAFADEVVQPPQNARMIVDDQKKTFASVPCVVLGKTERELLKNRQEARDRSKALHFQPYAEEVPMWQIDDRRVAHKEPYRRDAVCNDANGFDQVRSFWDRIFDRPLRWTSSGEWRF